MVIPRVLTTTMPATMAAPISSAESQGLGLDRAAPALCLCEAMTYHAAGPSNVERTAGPRGSRMQQSSSATGEPPGDESFNARDRYFARTPFFVAFKLAGG
jgi:hypothetical protein